MRNDQRKISANQVLWTALTFSLLLITLIALGQPRQKNKIKKPLTTKPKKQADTLAIPKPATIDSSLKLLSRQGSDTSILKDTQIVVTDTFDLNNISSDSLEAQIDYTAQDSGVLDIPGKKFYLYGKANAKYQTMDITAAVIEIDNQAQLARAYGVKDSAGLTIGSPTMKDDEMTSDSDSLIFNMKTQKGLTKKTLTKQGEMYVYAERIKKVSYNSYFAFNGRFTTCNLDTPHFAFRTKKMKLVNNKWAYSGLTYPEFEGVPIPVGIPFGIFPLSKGRHSGLLAPSFSATQYFGLGLEGLGYYKVLNEQLDVTVRSNIYSYGGYMLNVVPSYRKRYRYNGGINFTFQHTKFNFKGDPDFNVSNTYSLAWFHSMDGKARPGTSFSANVNVSSSKFNRYVANNTQANFTNSLNSSVQYSKSWKQGKYNLQVSGTHSQNNQQGLYNIGLPNLNFNAATFFPFKKEESAGTEKWYEKLGISYSGQLQNQFAFYDSVRYGKDGRKPFFKHLLDTAQWAVNHSIPITLSLPQLGPFQVSPGISYSERWFGQKILHAWNPAQKRLDTTLSRGLFALRDVSTSLSFQTGIFGKYAFSKGYLVGLRHTIRPSFSLNYKPDLEKKFHYDTQVDTLGTKLNFSSITGYQGITPGPFGGMSFGINQQLEAKVKDRSDTSGKGTKIIKLIDNLSINSGYNFFADSNKLSDISIYLGTTLFNKISITASTSLVPYKQDKYGRRTAAYAWSEGGFKLGNINSGSLSLSTSLQSKKKDEKKEETETKGEQSNEYYNADEDLRQQEYIRNHPAEFTDFNIPWTLSLSFSLNFSKQPKPDYSGFVATTSASLNLSGDFSLTPKWKMGGSGYIDARTVKLEQFTMFVSREMHCWQLSINVTPIGLYPSFNISINPKSGILRDLKINRTRSFQTVL